MAENPIRARLLATSWQFGGVFMALDDRCHSFHFTEVNGAGCAQSEPCIPYVNGLIEPLSPFTIDLGHLTCPPVIRKSQNGLYCRSSSLLLPYL